MTSRKKSPGRVEEVSLEDLPSCPRLTKNDRYFVQKQKQITWNPAPPSPATGKRRKRVETTTILE
jgi:hypothetical protein